MGFPLAIIRRLGNIPPPAPGEPWMYALGDPGVLQRRLESRLVFGMCRCMRFLYSDVCHLPLTLFEV